MFKDILDEINKDLVLLKNDVKILEYLNKKEIDLLQLHKQYNSATLTSGMFKPELDALNSALAQANEILLQEGTFALELTKEFNLPMFRTKFIRALKDPKSIKLFPSGEALIVIINLDETAGTLASYATAVDTARKNLNIGRYKTEGMIGSGEERRAIKVIPPPAGWASHFWAEKYYKPAREGGVVPHKAGKKDKTASNRAKYFMTIKERVGLFAGLAPFWEIIDRGSLGAKFPTDQGGYPYPQTNPTNFTEKTINKLQAIYRESLQASKKTLKDLQMQEKYLLEAIQLIKSMKENIAAKPLEVVIEEIVRQRLKERFDLADEIKLKEFLRALAAGEALSPKVSLGYTPEGVRIRPRTVELKRMVESFRKR